MYLSNIQIHNFKGIKNADFQFSPSVNLIIGNNGTGKTSVLEAISVALGGFLAGIDKIQSIHFMRDEIRQENIRMGDGSQDIQYKTPVRVEAELSLDNTVYHFVRQKKSVESSRSTIEPRDICQAAKIMSENENSILPVISYQSITRVSNQKREKWTNPFSARFSRAIGYMDCLDETTNTKMLTNWFSRMEQIAWQKNKKIAEYETVKQAISGFMSIMLEQQDISIYYDKQVEELVYSSDNETLPLRLLSSGFRALIGMVMDIACRMALLNPNLKDGIIKKTPGIVLIDEIDLHLHPKWQWKVVEALQHTFPAVQFIMTTHSPIIIASCRNNNLISLNVSDGVLDDPNEIQITKTVLGWQVDDVLRQYMDTDNRAPETVEKLRQLKQLAGKKITGSATDEELQSYHQLIAELQEQLPEGDIAIEKAAMLSIAELLGE